MEFLGGQLDDGLDSSDVISHDGIFHFLVGG